MSSVTWQMQGGLNTPSRCDTMAYPTDMNGWVQNIKDQICCVEIN